MDWFLGIVIALSVLGGLYMYVTRGDDEYEDIDSPIPIYDDPLLEQTFDSPVIEYGPDTPTRVYDSHGTLVFGHQDDTDDLDEPEVDDLA